MIRSYIINYKESSGVFIA